MVGCVTPQASAARPKWRSLASASRSSSLSIKASPNVFPGNGYHGPALAVNLALAEPGSSLRLILERKEVRYYVVRGDELLAVDPRETQVDRGVYLLLAELTAQG